jgi:hypothetical protein
MFIGTDFSVIAEVISLVEDTNPKGGTMLLLSTESLAIA